jgi:hypothetical protein
MLVLQQDSFELLEVSLDLYLDFFGLEWSAKGSRCNCTFLCIHGQGNSTTFFCAYINEIAEETLQLVYMSISGLILQLCRDLMVGYKLALKMGRRYRMLIPCNPC